MRQVKSMSEPASPDSMGLAGGASATFSVDYEMLLQAEIARLTRERGDAGTGGQSIRLEAMALVADAMGEEIRRLRVVEQQQLQVISIIRASSSWKLTAPLRAISDAWHSMRRRRDHGLSETSEVPTPVERQRSRDMLVIADMPPLYDHQSGGLRLFTLLELFREAGWSLSFGCYFERSELPDQLISADGKARYEGALHALGIDRILYGEAEIAAYLDEPGTNIDWAFISYPSVAGRYMPLVRARFPNVRIAFDMVDFHSLRIERQAELTSDPVRFAEAGRVRDQEIGLARAADVTIAVTQLEKEAVLSLVPSAVVEVLPCIFDVPAHAPPDLAQRRGLFFIGNFLHAPNGDSIHWFVERIWPLIRAQEPAIDLSIAGSSMTDDIVALGNHPGIKVLGHIPEVPPLLDRHRVFVAPLRFGAGMKGKVGQSLANGLPVVATTIGAEGMGLVHGQHILIADEEHAFANDVVRLLRDDDLWRHLSVQGRRHIGRTLSRSAIRDTIGDIFSP